MSPTAPRNAKLKWIPIEKIVPNENNPRSRAHFEKEELVSLRQSIDEHGILQPILVQPYRDGAKDDRYLLLEGERRFSVARDLGMKELPAVVGTKLDDHGQLVTMYHVHTQYRGWEMAEQLRTIKELIDRNPSKSESELADELGITLATYKNRLRVLAMGPDVVKDIATDKIEYSSALRAAEVAASLGKKRPELVKKFGGTKKVQQKLITKAKKRGKGISNELVAVRKDLTDVETVPDKVVEKYIDEPSATLRDLHREQVSLEERRQTEGLARVLRRTEKEIRAFDADIDDVPNIRELGTALDGLIDAAQELETSVLEAVATEDD